MSKLDLSIHLKYALGECALKDVGEFYAKEFPFYADKLYTARMKRIAEMRGGEHD